METILKILFAAYGLIATTALITLIVAFVYVRHGGQITLKYKEDE